MTQIFGLDNTSLNAKLNLIPVPWEATASYGRGTSGGPLHIFEESLQIDLYDEFFKDVYKQGIFCNQIDPSIIEMNEKASQAYLNWINSEYTNKKEKDLVNELSIKINNFVYKQSEELLNQGKIVGVVGGDHSTPFGLIKALCELEKETVGILHIDAHADLRKSYEQITDSHASIMYNVIENFGEKIELVQVGIRDYCLEEKDYIESHENIKTYFDQDLKSKIFNGSTWSKLCDQIIETLPKKNYVSFDIDGLSPDLCPNTGTPVPGGLSFDEARFLIQKLSSSGREIIGFDLVEVAGKQNGSRIDAIIGMRMLYQLCGLSLYSQELNAK